MVQCVATGDTGMQTGYEAPGRTLGLRALRRDRSRGRRARRGPARGHAARRGAGARPGRSRSCCGGARAACSSTRRAGTGSRPTTSSKDASVFTGRVGEQVASPLVTLVDDGTYGREWGTLRIDDEGKPAQRNVLIENGVLTDYMWDLLRARKEGRPSSGNGRRQTYRHLPMVRMTNTFLLEGDTDPDDIVRGVDYGIYCAQLGGGQVDPGDRRLRVRCHRGVPDRERRDHAPDPRRAADRQRSRSAAASSTSSATTSRRGPGCAARTARAFRCRRVSRRCSSAR